MATDHPVLLWLHRIAAQRMPSVLPRPISAPPRLFNAKTALLRAKMRRPPNARLLQSIGAKRVLLHASNVRV